MPNISIITPAFNAEAYLPACAGSIFAQKAQDFEWILVDDGSSDGTAALCDALAGKDKRIRVLHQARGGVSAARNAGMAAASGRFFSFIDTDDTVSPIFLEALLEAMAKCRADIGLCSYEWIDETGAALNRSEKALGTCLDRDTALNRLFFHDASKPLSAYTSACNKLYRRQLFGTVRFPEGRLFEDYAIMYRLMTQARSVAVVPTPLYQRRRHAASLSSAAIPELFYDKVTADSELIEFTRQEEYLYLLPFALQSFWSNFVFNQQFYLSPESAYKPYAKRAQKLLQQHLSLVSRHTTFTAAEKRRMKVFAYTPWLARPHTQ